MPPIRESQYTKRRGDEMRPSIDGHFTIDHETPWLLYSSFMDHLWTPWRYNYVSHADKDHRKGVPSALAAWPGDLSCVFCNMIASVDFAIAAGSERADAEQAAYILHRGKTCFICLNAFPYSTGHLMIVPYRHLDSLATLDSTEAVEMITLAQAAERCLRAIYNPDGLNFGLNLGESAGAGVANHIHLHGLPRWSGDTNFMTVTAETRVLPETLDSTWERLREHLRGQPIYESVHL